jgi:diguanylate cyclase (GGDEF)-like protein
MHVAGLLQHLHSGRHPHGGDASASSREHDVEAAAESVDPGYWPRAIGMRVVIAVCYALLVPAGVLPMSDIWWLASGGTLLVYSLLMLAHYLIRGVTPIETIASAYLDSAVVTLAIVALAKPEYPIWMGYFLILPSLANFHSSRYVAGFATWSIVNCWAAFAVLEWTNRADVSLPFVVVVSVMAIFTAANADIIAVSNRKLRALVRTSALTDPLTGLDNRRRFRQVLESHDVPASRPLAVLMYDIDNFKLINEEHGHVHADTVLVRIAEELRATFRDADTIARYGGDELIVLAHVRSMEEATILAQRSIEHVRATTGVSMSAGVAVYPVTMQTLESAVREADDALGRAKRAGKFRIVAA